jgi:hypothetical protein
VGGSRVIPGLLEQEGQRDLWLQLFLRLLQYVLERETGKSETHRGWFANRPERTAAKTLGVRCLDCVWIRVLRCR